MDGKPSRSSIQDGLEASDTTEPLNTITDCSCDDEGSMDGEMCLESLVPSTDEIFSGREPSEGKNTDITLEALKKKVKLKQVELAIVLKERRNSKSIKRDASQEQMLGLIKEYAIMKKEEPQFKRRMMEQYAASEQQYGEVM